MGKQGGGHLNPKYASLPQFGPQNYQLEDTEICYSDRNGDASGRNCAEQQYSGRQPQVEFSLP